MGAYSALAVTRDVSAELLQPAEAAFDAISELVEDAVMGSSQRLDGMTATAPMASTMALES